MQACFIGHRTIENSKKLKVLIKKTVVTLINKGVTTFLFGSVSDFDKMSWEIVSELKSKYPVIKRIYVRSAYPHIDKVYEKYLFSLYEGTYFPNKIATAGKTSYVERNYEMIDKSSYCVFYYNEKYVPPTKGKDTDNVKVRVSRNSGTKIAYKYAIKLKKQIINLYEQ